MRAQAQGLGREEIEAVAHYLQDTASSR
jgi:hypothetical protein